MYKHFSKEQLAHQYSPSSCVKDIKIYINTYIQKSKLAKEKALKDKLVHTDLAYSSSIDTTLDLYLPYNFKRPGHQKQKLQVYIHGGYWQELSKEESSFAATNFQKHHCYFAVIDYSLAPHASLTEIVEQNRLAIVWLYQHAQEYGYDKNEIYLCGSSAGAHLAIMMLYTNWSEYISCDQLNNLVTPIKGICAVSGIYDLTPIAQTYINEPLQLTEDEILTNSPLLLPMKGAEQMPCNIIISYGQNETTEFKRQSQELKEKLSLLGYQVCFHEIAERNHFDVILDLANENTWLFTQVLKQMDLHCAFNKE
ncbi:alpha/beta hydrolase [Thalassotalea profundi]|uniref:Esterase n=1 Tax=Thalassotalea profundi TaxID=2036687 RepID=A0ABQ3J3X2_9GAMM|nr:alpha/beta hydrolase [Thalassotalea profundi]GHF00071.1 esterase [Thalassotalea profundi]